MLDISWNGGALLTPTKYPAYSKKETLIEKNQSKQQNKTKKPFKKKERKNTGGTIWCFEAHIFHAG